MAQIWHLKLLRKSTVYTLQRNQRIILSSTDAGIFWVYRPEAIKFIINEFNRVAELVEILGLIAYIIRVEKLWERYEQSGKLQECTGGHTWSICVSHCVHWRQRWTHRLTTYKLGPIPCLSSLGVNALNYRHVIRRVRYANTDHW